jgi:diguanylate cyclase (GGDEF)-like protein/PAS domain S-box-containing protein
MIQTQLRSARFPEESELTNSWFRDWGNVLVVALAAYVAAFLLWVTFEWGSERTLMLVREAGYPPVMLIGVILAWRMALVAEIPRRTRQAWAVIGFAFLLWLAADSLWAYYHVTGVSVAVISLFDPAYLLSSLVLAAGILIFPAESLRGKDRTRFWIDCGIIITGLSALTAYIIVGPGYLERTSTALGTLILLAYPLSHMLVLIVLFSILVRRPDAGSVGVLMLLGAGLLIYAGTDFWWTYLEVRDRYVSEAVTYGTWMIAQALLVLSPQRHYEVLRQRTSSDDPWRTVRQARVFVPYFAAAVGLLIVGYAILPDMIDRIGLAVVFLTLLMALIIARQIVTIRENSELRLQRAVQRNEERFKALIEHSSDMVAVLDRNFRFLYRSPGAARSVSEMGVVEDSSLFVDLVAPEYVADVQRALETVTSTKTSTTAVEWQLNCPDGEPRYFETIISNRLHNPTVSGLVLNSRDITDRKRLESRLSQLAFYDPLTRLPNRTSFFDTLTLEMQQVTDEHGIGLMFVDIDNFKFVNDTYGHDVGDALLQEFSDRLLQSVRPGDVLSRLAGDEFTVMLPGLRNADEAGAVAERILQRMEQPFQIGEHEISVSSSVGIALTNDADADKDELLRRADMAMYAAKSERPGAAALFQPETGYNVITRNN